MNNHLEWPPHITVAAVIEHEGKFLIVEETADGRVVYNQPAGHLEPNESLIAAVSRETLEETGWHFTPTAIVGMYFYKGGNGITYQRICFTGNTTDQSSSKPLDSNIIQALWLSREELVQRSDKLRSPMVLQCIDDYSANQHYPLELITDLRQL